MKYETERGKPTEGKKKKRETREGGKTCRKNAGKRKKKKQKERNKEGARE